ncbi:MAG: serine/threonine-protein kinase [Deltaproteobacteria bacterium]|nr:serine/threonine-protein kinase [Deltaproteobacteria bacterium]
MSERFGDYELVSPLARGGMAELFIARHTGSGQNVVVKRLLPEMEARQDVVDLFLTEADIGQLLRHDNVVRVLDAGEVDGHYFLVMEHVDGLDADHVLADAWREKAPIPAPVALRVAVDALRGLHFAHELTSPQGTRFGLVHRDVSPDNLFLTSSGQTKVADFGIAKLASLEGATQVGLLKGKLTYMAPEQVQGRALDGRADGYALSLVLYEMLSSVRPYATREGESEVQHLMRVRDGSMRSLSSLEPDLPRGITRAVGKMLRAWRFWRFSSCGAYADTLEKAASSSGLLGSYGDVAAHVAMVRARVAAR